MEYNTTILQYELIFCSFIYYENTQYSYYGGIPSIRDAGMFVRARDHYVINGNHSRSMHGEKKASGSVHH